MSTRSLDLSDLRQHLLNMLLWAREHPEGMSVVLGRATSVAELDDEGIPLRDDDGKRKQISQAAVLASKLSLNQTPLLQLLQPAEDLASLRRTLSDAICVVDLCTSRTTAETAKGVQEQLENLSDNQTLIYGALTDQLKTAREIAQAAGVSDEETRRQLPNLKRMGLVDHVNRQGYRRRH